MQTTKHQPKNGFERSARFAKVHALTRALDREIRKHGADPNDDPHAVADALAKWPASDWARLAIAYGIRPPSPITIGQVLDGYRARDPQKVVIETTGEELPAKECA
jgi:hypothetical protein